MLLETRGDYEFSQRLLAALNNVSKALEKLDTKNEPVPVKPGIRFEKVSFNQFTKDWQIIYGMTPHLSVIEDIYDQIKLPTRSTAGSAGYDFKIPAALTLEPGKSEIIPTGIRAIMPEDTVLMIYPRSGLGFKYRMQLNNTVGVIDSDYTASDNEGHILVKITNDTNENKNLKINEGDAFVQGIFTKYLTVEGDNITAIRNGGFGSTDKRTKEINNG